MKQKTVYANKIKIYQKYFLKEEENMKHRHIFLSLLTYSYYVIYEANTGAKIPLSRRGKSLKNKVIFDLMVNKV